MTDLVQYKKNLQDMVAKGIISWRDAQEFYEEKRAGNHTERAETEVRRIQGEGDTSASGAS